MDSGRESESTSYANDFVVIAACAALDAAADVDADAAACVATHASRRGLFFILFFSFFGCLLGILALSYRVDLISAKPDKL